MSVDSPAGLAALDRLREICLALPEVNERPSHMTPTFFIRDKKVLCHLWEDHHGDGRLAIWCPAPDGVQKDVTEREPERFFVPRYVGHRGWIGLRLDVEVDWSEVAAVLDDAYRVAAPKTLIRELDERRSGDADS